MPSDFMTLLDRLCKSKVAKYGAELDNKNPTIQRAAKMYHALADIRDFAQNSLPEGVYSDLDRVTTKFKNDVN